MNSWTSAPGSTDLIDRARRMHRQGVPKTSPIRAAVADELFRRAAQAALQSVTPPDRPDYTANPQRTAS